MKVEFSLVIPETKVSKVLDVEFDNPNNLKKSAKQQIDDVAKELMPKLQEKSKNLEVKWYVRVVKSKS